MPDTDSIQPETTADTIDSELLAHKQALQYGKDLARIFVAERAKREKLQVAYQTLNAVFASTPDAIVVLDEAHTIQQANQAFSDLVRVALPDLTGQPLSDYFPDQAL